MVRAILIPVSFLMLLSIFAQAKELNYDDIIEFDTNAIKKNVAALLRGDRSTCPNTKSLDSASCLSEHLKTYAPGTAMQIMLYSKHAILPIAKKDQDEGYSVGTSALMAADNMLILFESLNLKNSWVHKRKPADKKEASAIVELKVAEEKLLLEARSTVIKLVKDLLKKEEKHHQKNSSSLEKEHSEWRERKLSNLKNRITSVEAKSWTYPEQKFQIQK